MILEGDKTSSLTIQKKTSEQSITWASATGRGGRKTLPRACDSCNFDSVAYMSGRLRKKGFNDLNSSLDQWFLTLGYSGVFGLQLPEAFTTSCAGWGFWGLQFKNT